MRRAMPEAASVVVGIAALIVVVLLLAACGDPRGSSPDGSESAGPVSVPTGTHPASPSSTHARSASPAATPSPSMGFGALRLTELLALLRVAPERRDGYDRDLFPQWSDDDGDGCNTRWEVLIAESLTPVSVAPGCRLGGGTWFSVYDGLTFVDPAQVSIDHVVALAEAWDSGAWTWSPQRREAFANDLGTGWELIVVSPDSNSRKSDMDPADWLPDRPEAICDYLGDWLAVKVRWDLTVDQPEHDAIARRSGACASTRRLVIRAQADASAGESASVTPSACDPAYPGVCIPPPPPDLDCADVAYLRFTVLEPDPHRFDGDHDGIGCEG